MATITLLRPTIRCIAPLGLVTVALCRSLSIKAGASMASSQDVTHKDINTNHWDNKYISSGYAQFRPRYPEALFQEVLSRAAARGTCVDIGCGTGQATEVLAQHFDTVVGIDPSETQLTEARQTAATNVTYRVGVAHSTGVADASADLVTVAQAVHWFDHEKFNAEVTRILKPGGVYVCWGYGTNTIDNRYVMFHCIHRPMSCGFSRHSHVQ